MTRDALQLRDLLETARTASAAGAAIVRAAASEPRPAADVKGRGDYVTAVDRASEAAILAVLAAGTPDIPVLGEESGGRLDQRLLWVVDPLDGTTNFVHRLPAVGISVALVAEGTPVVGVVLAPLLDLEFTAATGRGAKMNGEPIRTATRPAPEAVIATGFPFRLPQRRTRYLQVFGPAMATFEDLRRVGAASLDLAWTAAGVFDGFFELGLSPWDVAAGALLVREAGGIVTDWAGGDTWLETGDILAAGAEIHAALAGVVARAG